MMSMPTLRRLKRLRRKRYVTRGRAYDCPQTSLISFFKQVEKAKETENRIDAELKTLQQTLADIEEARPFDQLTVRLC